MEYYNLPVEKVIKQFQTHKAKGLSDHEIKKRLARYGPNLLPVAAKPLLIFKFLAQFKNVLVIILIIATIVSFALGDILDAVAIATIILVNATIGFIQEVKAEKTLQSLKKMEKLVALVVRNSSVSEIPSSEIVPGDILILEEGNKIAADARLIESFSLRIDESILTGESKAVSKNPNELPENTIPADQKNMVFRDTQVLAGRGTCVVVATGADTQMGQIARSLTTTAESETPLTRELEIVGKLLSIVIGIIAILLFFLNFLKQTSLIESLLISISLSVAAIPEGLPAIVTVVLSLGVKRLADKKTIVKKLPAVESLGAIKIIATDKTGTITQNKINVTHIQTLDRKNFTVEGTGYSKVGTFFDDKSAIINPDDYKNLIQLLNAGVLSSNARVNFAQNENTENKVLGDTTEAALIVAAARANINPESLRKTYQRKFEVPFSSERKMMSVVVEIEQAPDYFHFAKGAPEEILSKCLINDKQKTAILKIVVAMSAKGLRPLAMAFRKLSTKEYLKIIETSSLAEENLEYLGLTAMQDPLRLEVKSALQSARAAGIKTIMVTGDHAATAQAIARQAGIMQRGDKILTEDQVQKLTLKELGLRIKKNTSVFARISPLSKLKIIQSIKLMPHYQVAVTGDGVNDAPALKAADIGVAMGQTGTDLTREVADIILTDDNYATIVDAVREGRVIYANLVKFIRYLISCNLSEVIVVAAGVLLGTPAVLLPIQILWINLITDGFPALALGVDPPEFDVMKRPPRDLSSGILHKKRWFYMLIEGSIMGLTTLGLFLYANSVLDYRHAQTMAFTTLAFAQLTHAFNNRSTRKSIFQIGVFGNKPLVWASLISIFLQILIVQTDIGNLVIKTVALEPSEWLLVAAVSLMPLLIVEVKKQLRFRILP